MRSLLERNCRIADMLNGDQIYAQFLVTEVKQGVTANGRAYITVSFQDSTGVIDGKKWDSDAHDLEIFIKGNVVMVEADVILYNNALQLKILGGEKVAQSSINWADFVPNAPFPLKEMEEKLNLYIASIENEDIRVITEEFVKRNKEKFLNYPAAVRNHHNYVGGIIYHSLTMADLALYVCKVYPSLNRDVVLAGTIIHDIGKTVELSGPNATAFTMEGKLCGHISLGHAMLHRVAEDLGYFAYDSLTGGETIEVRQKLYAKKEAALVLEHIVLSHHGKNEFGSPVTPITRESFAVAMIDDFDAKMNILDKAYKDIPHGETTAKIMSMDDRYFFKPSYVNDDFAAPGISLEEAKKFFNK